MLFFNSSWCINFCPWGGSGNLFPVILLSTDFVFFLLNCLVSLQVIVSSYCHHHNLFCLAILLQLLKIHQSSSCRTWMSMDIWTKMRRLTCHHLNRRWYLNLYFFFYKFLLRQMMYMTFTHGFELETFICLNKDNLHILFIPSFHFKRSLLVFKIYMHSF